MNCKSCGSFLTPEDKFCKGCGAPVVQQNQPVQSEVFNNQPQFNNNPQPQAPVNNNFPNQNYNQQNQMGGYNEPKKGSNNLLMILLFSFLGVSLIVAIFMIISLSKDATTKEISGYKVNYKGYSLTIPEEYNYQETDDSIVLVNDAETALYALSLIEVSYTDVVNRKEAFKQLHESQGTTVGLIREKLYSGMEYITFEFSKDQQNLLVGYTKAGTANSFGITLIVEDNTYNYSLFEELSSIIESAEYVGINTGSNMNVDKIDLKTIEQLN